MRNRKAQMQEFIAISLLVVALILFVMFNRIGQTGAALSKAEAISITYERDNLWTGATVMLYTTLNGHMMMNLLGNYMCYDKEVISYSASRNINISDLLFKVLDTYYGEERWSLELRSQDLDKCYHGTSIQAAQCVFPDQIEFEAYDFMYPMPCDQTHGEGTLYVY